MTTDQNNQTQPIPAYQPQPGYQPTPPAPAATKPAWYRRTWVLVAGAVVVGISLGSASAEEIDPTTTAAYKAVASDRDEARDELAALGTELTQAQADLTSAEAEIETIAGDLPGREEALAKAQTKLEKAEASFEDRQATLVKEEKAVAAREKKVGIVETTIANNTIAGDGLYQVGADMKAGTYKSAGTTDCYYAVLASPNTSDILNNNITSGPAIVTLSAGQFFETSRCRDWVWQG